ncbi:MAG: hypothetical protein GSR78_04600 [Desulfurococcales archaeon]|nr:hypothetical protein [Desulfurococcales archaeon]
MAPNTLFFHLLSHRVVRSSIRLLFQAVIAGLIVILLAPSGYSLWYDNLGVEVEVYTADFTYPRSSSYWAGQIQWCMGGSYTAATAAITSSVDALDRSFMLQLLSNVSNDSIIFEFNGTEDEMLAQALAVLNARDGGVEDKLVGELLALWLNEESGYSTGYTLQLSDGTSLTARDLILLIEEALAEGNTDSYNRLAQVAEDYNTRWER